MLKAVVTLERNYRVKSSGFRKPAVTLKDKKLKQRTEISWNLEYYLKEKKTGRKLWGINSSLKDLYYGEDRKFHAYITSIYHFLVFSLYFIAKTMG